MKKLVALVLSLLMILSLAACGSGDTNATTTAGGETKGTSSSSADNTEKIKIGVVCAISGPYAQEGQYV